MPILADWDLQLGLLMDVWVEPVDAELWEHAQEELLASPNLLRTRRVLSDITRWHGDPSVDAERVAVMARGFKEAESTVRDLRLAVLVRDAVFEAETFSSEVAPFVEDAVVCHELGAACRWLGLEPSLTASRLQKMADLAPTADASAT